MGHHASSTSTTSTCDSSGWLSGESPSDEARASSASSPTSRICDGLSFVAMRERTSGGVRPTVDRLSERRQPRDREAHAGRRARPQCVLDGAEPRGHPSRHSHRSDGAVENHGAASGSAVSASSGERDKRRTSLRSLRRRRRQPLRTLRASACSATHVRAGCASAAST